MYGSPPNQRADGTHTRGTIPRGHTEVHPWTRTTVLDTCHRLPPGYERMFVRLATDVKPNPGETQSKRFAPPRSSMTRENTLWHGVERNWIMSPLL